MLNHTQMQERNAHLMNTVPGTRVILSTTMGNPDMWIGSNTLIGYDGYLPRFGTFGFMHPKDKGIVVNEDSPNWDFEVHSE